MVVRWLFFLFFVADVHASGWVSNWVDGPAQATYERTSSYLRTYINVPSSGGHVQWTLNSSPNTPSSSLKTGSYFGAASTSVTPKIATNFSIPVGKSAGTAVLGQLTAVIPKNNLAKAAVAFLRVNPYISTALTVGWLGNAGYEYFSDTGAFAKSMPVGSVCASGYMSGSRCFSSPTVACDVSQGTNKSFGFSVPVDFRTGYYQCSGMGFVCSLIGGSYCMMTTATSPVPVSADEVLSVLPSKPVSGTADTAVGFDGLLKELSMGGFQPSTDGETPLVSGSIAPVQGANQVVTSPDGTVTTESTSYSPVYNSNYVDLTETTTTTVVSPDGQVGTTTSTAPAEVADQPNECEKHPDTIGCSQFGVVPTPDVLPKTDVPISLAPVSWGASACPVPSTIHTRYGNLVLSNTHVCTFLGTLNPIVILVAWLSAGFIVLGAVKE